MFPCEQEVYNPMHGKKIVTDSDDDLGGGIDLKKAVARMREEDKKDKEIYRQRVKDMHRVGFPQFSVYLCHIENRFNSQYKGSRFSL